MLAGLYMRSLDGIIARCHWPAEACDLFCIIWEENVTLRNRSPQNLLP